MKKSVEDNLAAFAAAAAAAAATNFKQPAAAAPVPPAATERGESADSASGSDETFYEILGLDVRIL